MKKKNSRKRSFEREEFSAFEELGKKSSWYMYFVGTQNYIENYLVANHCNKTIAIVLNHCVVDPASDLQLEELIWSKSHNKIGVNIYCRKSNEKKWSYQTSRVLAKQ